MRLRRVSLFPILILLTLLTACSSEHNLSRSLLRGQADLAHFNFTSTSLVRLNGNWHFWPGQLLSDREVRTSLAAGSGSFTAVPGLWSKTGITGKADDLLTTGTIALELHLPAGPHDWALRLPNADTACTLFIDGIEAAHIGSVSASRIGFVPNNGLAIVPFHTETGSTLLVLHVANFAAPYTGTWDSPLLGSADSIQAKRRIDIILASLISGAMLFMGLYHLGLFILRRKDPSPLIFGLICILMAVRNLAMGERILLDLFPLTWGGWQAAFTIEHLSAHMVLPLFYLFFMYIFPRQLKRLPVGIVCAISALWAVLEICTPAMFHQRFLSSFEYFLLASALYMVYILFTALRHKEEGAIFILVGIIAMLVTVINDVLFSNGIIQSFYMSSIGLFLFTFAQSFFLSLRFSSLFFMVERYASELQNLNQSLERFIPHEVLGFLNKKSIIDVNLGDFSEQYMSVFFLDIRDFTSLSETMTPEDNFRFINSFLEKFGPLIRQNGGFIDKYLGDGIMALFPGEPDHALNAALSMREMLVTFNNERAETDIPIRFGIGIHSGMLMLGTIGENQRMDSTVISDTVNTASRLEQLTKLHEADILLSAETVDALKHPENYQLVPIGKEKVKGRERTIMVYALDFLDIAVESL